MTESLKDFIYTYARMIAAQPDDISIAELPGEGHTEIIVYARGIDAGRLIGKGGKVISACKSVAVSSKFQQKTNYKITVKTLDE